MKCPGQNMQSWKPTDIYEVDCPVCGQSIEFFKDDPHRICSSCKSRVMNPNKNIGCREWCEFADACYQI